MVHAVLSALHGQLCSTGEGWCVCVRTCACTSRGRGNQQCTSSGPDTQADSDHTAILMMTGGSFCLFFCSRAR